MNVSMISLAAAVMFAAGAASAASVHLTYATGAPVVDTDGQLTSFGGPTLPDIDWYDFSSIDLNIAVFGLDLGDIVGDTFDFTFSEQDFVEIGDLTSLFIAPNVSIINQNAGEIEYRWALDGSEAAGYVLASVNVETLDLGFRPHDEFADLILAATGTTAPSFGIWNPVLAARQGDVEYDAQEVPLPAGILLLGGALVGLRLVRRKAGPSA